VWHCDAESGAVHAINIPRRSTVRNGQPGAPMPAMRPFDMSLAVDILAFAGTLPPE
jgi:hypothetical protein